MQNTLSVRVILLLAFSVAVYSLSGLFSKQASFYDAFSLPYLFYLCAVVGVLGCYAVLWQMALKRVLLNQAYPFRSLSLIFGLIIAYFVYQETVTMQNLIGAAIVMFGLLIITTGK